MVDGNNKKIDICQLKNGDKIEVTTKVVNSDLVYDMYKINHVVKIKVIS